MVRVAQMHFSWMSTFLTSIIRRAQRFTGCKICNVRSSHHPTLYPVLSSQYLYRIHDSMSPCPCFRFALHHNLQNILDPLLTEEADPQSIMEAAFRKTHEGILHIAMQTDPPDESGTTATVALVLPHRIIIAHVGDSRAILCCREGKAWVVTKGITIH